MAVIESWLIDKPALTHVVARQRTHECRSEIAHAVIARSGPPDWQQSSAASKAYNAALVIAERVGTDPDVLIEALLWDTDVAEWCWSEGHERCCSEGFEHADDAHYEAVNAIWRGTGCPAWLSVKTYWRLRRRVWLAEELGDWAADTIQMIEEDDDIYESGHDEGVERHVAECLRGSVGENFHSIP